MPEVIHDVIVIGAGIAGVTVAAELAADADVLVLEAETQPAHHTTGRSAATFIENYGPAPVRALTRASRAFFESPPADLTDVPLLRPRGLLYVAMSGDEAALEAEVAAGVGIERLDRAGCIERVGALANGAVSAGAYEADARDIDVMAYHQGALRQLRARGGRLRCDARVEGAAWSQGAWKLVTTAGPVRGARVVNAAGAWGDEVARVFGARPVGLTPMRRSIGVVEVDGEPPVDPHWPLIASVAGDWYAKPESGALMVSPVDETPSPPCDAWPEDLDIALGVERMSAALGYQARRLRHGWAGLRTFAPDRCLVAGPDRDVAGLFWLVGQGGYGIQTAPAMAAIAARLVLGGEAAGTGSDEVATASLFPGRFD